MKKSNEQFKKFLRFLLTVLLIASETVIFAHAWITEYNNYIVVPFVQKGNWFFYLVHFILASIFLRSFDGLKYGTYRKANLITAQILAALATVFIIYLQIVLLAARFVSVLPMLYVFLADVAVIIFVTYGGNFVLHKLFPARKTLVIFDKYAPQAFIDKTSQRRDKFLIKEIANVSLGIEEITKRIEKYDCIVIYDVHSEQRNKILKICFENDKRVYTTTKVSDILIRGAECVHMFDTPLLLCRNIGLNFQQRFVKRTCDIVISALLLILTSPIFLLAALAIKCYDGGPVFFRQERNTINGRVFKIHKFRSMIVDAEADGAPHPAEEDDPRITPIGKFLRMTRLDELPQLIDILVGDMSIVGPRPERVEHTKQYMEAIPEFSYRLKVRGGLTGYAQLYGRYNTTPYDKLQLDLMYIENYSFLLDIKLFFMTVKIMFMKESTEGFNLPKPEENKKEDK